MKAPTKRWGELTSEYERRHTRWEKQEAKRLSKSLHEAKKGAIGWGWGCVIILAAVMWFAIIIGVALLK